MKSSPISCAHTILKGMSEDLGYLRALGFIYFARDPKYSWVHEHSKNRIHCLYLHFIINILNIKIIFNLGIKTVFYLKYNRINGLVGV